MSSEQGSLHPPGPSERLDSGDQQQHLQQSEQSERDQQHARTSSQNELYLPTDTHGVDPSQHRRGRITPEPESSAPPYCEGQPSSQAYQLRDDPNEENPPSPASDSTIHARSRPLSPSEQSTTSAGGMSATSDAWRAPTYPNQGPAFQRQFDEVDLLEDERRREVRRRVDQAQGADRGHSGGEFGEQYDEIERAQRELERGGEQ